MIPGVCAWIFVVLRTKPKVSSSLVKVSLRVGSSPGSSISRTRGTVRIIPPSFAQEPLLDRGQRLEEDAADDLEAPRRDLVERVCGGVPGRGLEGDQERRRHARAQEGRVGVLDGQRGGGEVRGDTPPRRGPPDGGRDA